MGDWGWVIVILPIVGVVVHLLYPAIRDRMRGYRPVKQAAAQYVRSTYPHWRCDGSYVRADEDTRYVVAVVYVDPDLLQKPPPYLLVAVSKPDQQVTELTEEECPAYRILGRK